MAIIGILFIFSMLFLFMTLDNKIVKIIQNLFFQYKQMIIKLNQFEKEKQKNNKLNQIKKKPNINVKEKKIIEL